MKDRLTSPTEVERMDLRTRRQRVGSKVTEYAVTGATAVTLSAGLYMLGGCLSTMENSDPAETSSIGHGFDHEP